MHKNLFLSKVLSLATVVGLVVGCSVAAQAGTWDLATDFNLTDNSGVWTYYGRDGGADGRLVGGAPKLMRLTDEGGSNFNSFYGTTLTGWIGYDYGWLGVIAKNTGASAETLLGATIAPGDFVSHTDADNSNDYSIYLVWTCPADDVVNISGSVKMINDGQNMWALKNNTTELASGFVTGGLGADSTAPFSYNNLVVAAGDTVELWLGSHPWGANLSKDTLTITTSTAGGPITGTFTFADQSDSPKDVGVAIDFMQSGAIVKTVSLFPDASGNYSITDIDRGTYDLMFRAHGWLHKLAPGVAVGVDGAVVNVDFASNGDIDGDNEVTSTDLSILGLNLGLTGD